MHQKVDMLAMETGEDPKNHAMFFNFFGNFHSEENQDITGKIVEWALQQASCVDDLVFVRNAVKVYYQTLRAQFHETEDQADARLQKNCRRIRITKVAIGKGVVLYMTILTELSVFRKSQRIKLHLRRMLPRSL